MDPQPERLALDGAARAAVHRRPLPPGAGGGHGVVPPGPPAVGAGRDPEHLRPHRALLHGPRRPRRGPGPRHPGPEGQLLGQDLGPAQGDARAAGDRPRAGHGGLAAGPGGVLPPQGPDQLHRRRRRRHRPARPPGGAAGRAAPRPRHRGPPASQPGARGARRAAARRPRGEPGLRGIQRLRGPAARVGLRLRRRPVPRQRPRGRGAGSVARALARAVGLGLRRRRPRARRWVAGRPGRLRRRARGPRHRRLADAPVDRDRAHRRPVGGRHRRQPRLRDADGVCPGARPPGGRVVGRRSARSGRAVGRCAVEALRGGGAARRHGPPPLEHRHPQPAVSARRTARAPGGADRRPGPPAARVRR